MRYTQRKGGKSTSSLALDCIDEVMFDGKPRHTKEILSGIWDIIIRKRNNSRFTKRESRNHKNKNRLRTRPVGSTSVPTKSELYQYMKLHPEYKKVAKGTWKYTGEIPKSHKEILRKRRNRKLKRIKNILKE